MSEKPDHNYKADTRIKLHVNISLVGCEQNETITIGDFLGIDDEELTSMTKAEVDKQLDETTMDWMWNHVDVGWYEDDD